MAHSAASARHRPSSRLRCRSTASPRSSACRRSSCAGGGCTRSVTTTPSGRSCARAWPARKCSSARPRRPSSSAFARRRLTSARRGRNALGRPARSRARYFSGSVHSSRGIGLALAWHGAGFTGSGEVKLASVASIELTADGGDPHPDRVDRDGPGHQDDLSAARRGAARRGGRRRSRSRRRTRRSCPTPGRPWHRGPRWSWAGW